MLSRRFYARRTGCRRGVHLENGVTLRRLAPRLAANVQGARRKGQRLSAFRSGGLLEVAVINDPLLVWLIDW
jgi:hypothetical protein